MFHPLFFQCLICRLVYAVSFVLISCSITWAEDIPLQSKLLKAVQSKGTVMRQAGNSSYISFLRVDARKAISDGNAFRFVQDKARTFLQTYKELFVDSAIPLELEVKREKGDGASTQSFVHFQQNFSGIPVRSGEIIVNTNEAGVTSVTSKLLSGLEQVDTVPGVFEQEALVAASKAVLDRYGPVDVQFSDPQLEIYNKAAMRGQNGLSRLAWFVEATGPALLEYIWIDAHSGERLDNFSQLAKAKAREIYDANNTSNLVDTLSRYEGDQPVNISDVDYAYDYLGDTYDYFFDTHGRDSYTNKGTTIKATVRYCEPNLDCPTAKAFWKKTEQQLAFGEGYALADDIVGHEFTHAVIEKTANLNFIGESGALAEAFADIFGEMVDQDNGAGTDGDAEKWNIGEDIPLIGAIRNMLNPDLFGDPARVSDNRYYCGSDEDVAIHTNNGVLNHAFALLVDGGSYNGFDITGIGPDKAAKIYYKTLTEHLPSTSLFSDAYNGLISSADELIAAGELSAEERTELVKTLEAVELNVTPCLADQVAYCPSGQKPAVLFSDDFENAVSGNWTSSVISGINHWSADGSATSLYNTIDPRRGHYSLFASTTPSTGDRQGDSAVAMTQSIALPPDSDARMQFEHNFTFESGANDGSGNSDGGVIEYSVDSGTTWEDAGKLISAGQDYTGIIDKGGYTDLALAGHSAFTGYMLTDGGSPANPVFEYRSTQLDLTSLAGQSVRFRYRVGTDAFGEARGWVIDDMMIYKCERANFVVDQTDGLLTSEDGASATFTIALGFQPSGTVEMNITSSDFGEGDVAPRKIVFNSLDWNIPQEITITGVDDVEVDGDKEYTVTAAVADTTTDPGYVSVTETVEVKLTNTDNDSFNDGSQKKSSSGGGALNPFFLLSLVLILQILKVVAVDQGNHRKYECDPKIIKH